MTEDEAALVDEFLKVVRSPKRIPVVRRGSRIYHTLKLAPGRVFPKSFLAVLIAKDPVEGGNEGSVIQCVKTLRDDAPEGHRIKTVRGEGYMWREE